MIFVLNVRGLCVVVDSHKSVSLCDFHMILTGRTQSGMWSRN